MTEAKVIYKTAIYSRLLLIFIQYISNLIIPDHQSEDAFLYVQSADRGKLDNLITHFFGGFVRWDAQHFMHISRYGYTYEHSLAFFPFCPYLVRFVTLLLSNCVPFINLDSLTLLVFICINTFCFIQSALILYELSLHVVSKELAYKASILFCYNPASVFFTAPYTECVFCYLTFKSMLNCVRLYKKYCDNANLQVKDAIHIVPICLSTLTRSNGVLNVGFLVYISICLYLDTVKLKIHIFDKIKYAIKFVTLTITSIMFCLLPFTLFQIWSFQRFCKDMEVSVPSEILQHPNINDFVLPGTFSQHNQTWCFKTLPLAYSYVQEHYWNVGFLKYYEFKQLPNFILASPIIVIMLNSVFEFFKRFPKEISQLFNFNLMKKSTDFSKNTFNPVMVVFVIHATVLTLFCVLNIHVQVTTRMLCSASPVIYWFSAYCMSDLAQCNLFEKIFQKSYNKRERFIIGYFLSYYVIGTVMFCNCLPWT